MLTKLRLENFKNFGSAELLLGPLTLLIGANATGKSNIRDAFRFLHGVSRGYNLPDIMGDKWIEAGVLQWKGIRGGIREATFPGSKTFTLEAWFKTDILGEQSQIRYGLEVNTGTGNKVPEIVREYLFVNESFIFDTKQAQQYQYYDPMRIYARVWKPGKGQHPTVPFISQTPIISQIIDRTSNRDVRKETKEICRSAISAFNSMRFLDLSPDSMRMPSLPGQTVLGDRGENLSSVLQEICENPENKQTLLQWLQELTPMDAADFDFPADQIGRVLVTLIEDNGQKTSAYSASDGTLRFLAMIAALLGPESARFYFFEELENGIHPTRLHLLLQLIEQQVQRSSIQMVATTHSPQLLTLVSPETLEYTSMTYRLHGRNSAQVKRILDIPGAREIIQEQDISRLHASGWLEDAILLTEEEQV